MPGRHDHREHRGLLLDFGGVLTTSLLEAIRRFCVECGLEADALLDLFRHDPVGRKLLVDVECGVLSQPEFEKGIAELLGVDHQRLAAERLGLPCEACVFVDDLPQNLEPARALGMSVIHKTSAEQLLTDLEDVLRIPLR
jgi:hypothetical protein